MQRHTSFLHGTVVEDEYLNADQDNALGIAQVPGIRVGLPYLYCNDGISLSFGATAGVMVSNNPNQNLSTSAAGSYTPSGLGNNTWYYLYQYNDSGLVGFEHSTTVPNAALVFKNGDTTRRYVGCFRTDGSAAILKFHSVKGRYLWDFSGEAANDFRVLNDGNALSFTGQSLSTRVPPHVRMVYIKVVFVPRFNESDSGAVRTAGGTGGQHDFSLYGASTDGLSPARSLEANEREIWMLTDFSQAIEYEVSHVDAIMDIHVLGFEEGI